MLTAIFVFGIGSMGRGGATPLKLVLAGSATGAALSSLVTAVMIPRSFVMNQFRFWQVGSVGAGTWESMILLLPFLLSGIIAAILCAPALNAMALGDEAASGLGVKTGVLRLVAAFAGVILCGATTAIAGPIGFIGLLGAHVIRIILGADLREFPEVWNSNREEVEARQRRYEYFLKQVQELEGPEYTFDDACRQLDKGFAFVSDKWKIQNDKKGQFVIGELTVDGDYKFYYPIYYAPILIGMKWKKTEPSDI